MDRIDRVVNDRVYKNRTKPFRNLEKRITEAFILERRIAKSKYSSSLKNQSEKQFLVFMISCLESYLEDMFRLMIDKNLINIDALMNIKKIKQIKLNISEINKIERYKIKISEIIAKEMNFQNPRDIMKFCNIIGFDNYSDTLLEKIKKGNIGFTKKESEDSLKSYLKMQIQSKKEIEDSNKLASAFFKYVIRNLYRHLEVDKEKIFGTIIHSIYIRHKIVHKASDVKIQQSHSMVLMLSIIQFASIIQEIYNIKLGKISARKI